jgi:hypothetical protein
VPHVYYGRACAKKAVVIVPIGKICIAVVLYLEIQYAVFMRVSGNP